jgi:hypothetical protein
MPNSLMIGLGGAALVLGTGGVALYAMLRHRQAAHFFDDHPMESFRVAPWFDGLGRDFALIGVGPDRAAASGDCTLIDEQHAIIGRSTNPPGNGNAGVMLEHAGLYDIIYRAKFRRTGFFAKDGVEVSSFARAHPAPFAATVWMASGEVLHVTAGAENPLFGTGATRRWHDEAGKLMAIVYNPGMGFTGQLRVIAIRRGLPIPVSSTILALHRI